MMKILLAAAAGYAAGSWYTSGQVHGDGYAAVTAAPSFTDSLKSPNATSLGAAAIAAALAWKLTK